MWEMGWEESYASTTLPNTRVLGSWVWAHRHLVECFRILRTVQETASQGDFWAAQTLLMQVIMPLISDCS